MMNFWKRTGQRDKTLNSSTTTTQPSSPTFCNGSIVSESNGTTQTNTGGIPDLLAKADYNITDIEDTFSKEHSRLSKTLSEILSDKNALGYFIQYLEARGALSYVKFWIDVENFRTAAKLSTSNESFAALASREELNDNTNRIPSISHDSLSVSTDCDSYTADSGSLFEYSCNNVSESGQTLENSEIKHLKNQNESENNKADTSSAYSCDKMYSDCNINSQINVSKQDGREGRLSVADSDKSNTLNTQKTLNKELLRAVSDNAIRIFRKYIAPGAPNSVRTPDEYRSEIVESLCNECNAHCFDRAQQYIFQVMERDFFNDFLQSNYYCKHQVDILTSGSVTLIDILYNETALFYFMEFLEQEGCRSLLEFWVAATNFRQHLIDKKSQYDPSQVQGDAMILYDKYFSLQATCFLGFKDEIRFDIEQNICHEDGPQINSFTKSVKIVEQVLEKNFLKSFLSSQLFFKYLSELINTIQSNSLGGFTGRHRRVGSDCSSEISSVSTHNTLLAMEDSSAKSRNKRTATDMSIDTRQLYDPDSLWRRRTSGGLNLGRVTELGRFETAVEPEPDKRSESKIGKVMRKLVNLQEDKAKEEMAWQIAEMIVKDITSVTLQNSAEPV